MEKSVSRLLKIFCLVLALGLPCFGQTTVYGGRGLMRVFTAEPIGRGHFFINTYFQTFLDPSKRNQSLGKDHTLSLAFTLGVTRRWELSVNPVVYQDDQKHVWGPPGDLRVGLKYASPLSYRAISTGLNFFANLPIAKAHNVAYEPYSSGKFGGGALGLVTIDMTDAFPIVPLKVYLNFGYYDHNFSGQPFSAEDDQYLIGAGIKFPIRSIVFFTEYSGEIFANNPALSHAENSTRVTQGLKFLGPWNFIIDLVGDLGLDKPVTGLVDPLNAKYRKDYADWKITLGLNYQVSGASGSERRLTTAVRLREDKRAMQELEQIRAERESADKKMKAMQESLEVNANATEEQPAANDPAESKPPEEKTPEEKVPEEKTPEKPPVQ